MMRDQKILDEEQINRAWRYHAAADVLFATRFNYYMVAQSMMLVSFATVFAADRHSCYEKAAELVIGAAGLFYAGVQWRVNRVLPLRMEQLRTEYLIRDPVYEVYFEVDPRQPKEARDIQAKWVPLAFVLVWLALALTAFAAPSTQGGVPAAAQGQPGSN